MDIISPTAIDFQPKVITNGEMYQRVLAIIDFPDRVGPGWLSRIANMPGIVTSIHATPTDPHELLNQIRVSMGELEAKLLQGGNAITLNRVEQQYKGTKHLIKKIDNESQAVFLVTVVMLVTAPDMDSLNERCKRVESALAASNMRGRTPMFKQEPGLRSVGPYRIIAPEIKELAARNMPVETIAAMYPFVYSGINDGDGVLLGSDKDGGILLVDFWVRDGSRTNSNVTLLGRPGVGKSTVYKKILTNENARGTKVIMIDPERECRDLCKNVGGDWINCGGGGKNGLINPLQIRQVPLDDDEEKDEDRLFTKEQINQGPLALHFQILRTFFKLYFGKETTRLDITYLELALEKVYTAKEIFWNTDISKLSNTDYPLMQDLFYWLEDMARKESTKPIWEKLMMLMRPAAVGADSALWNGYTTINPSSDFIVLDTHNLIEADKEIQQAQYFNVLGWSWNKVAEDRMQKVIIGGDEFYLNVDPENPEVLKFARNTSKRIRKYEGGLMVITHNMNDFMDKSVRRYGQSLLDNPVYKIIMGQGENDIKSLTELMHLSEKEIETLQTGNRGEALFIAGNRRLHATFEISPEELLLFGKGGGR
ncbi:conjugal transfer protein TraC [Paenibacillus agilis]|uniref:Conjugal transfer protein TraC n=1 Tax=Paenibacillus agilis TaxID=3020863 RepID=A0A559IDW9_9BACL|nr:conjugal transfer protein TraC [Paenibacillus agilis]